MSEKLNKKKDKEQQEHLKAWKSNNYTGTSIAATGLGKTRMGLLAIIEILEDDPNKVALVIVPTENLRDREWVEEFKNWHVTHLLPRVEFMCIQSAYKLTGHHWDLVIIDEVHTTLSLEYRKFYENNLWDNLYCLTATAPENKEYLKYLKQFAPIIRTTDVNKALTLGLVSPYKVYNLSVEFTPEEMIEYNKCNKMFNLATVKLGGMFVAFENATKYRNGKDPELKKWSNIFYIMMQKRKKICFNASNKIKTTQQIVNKFMDRKALIFSENITFAEDLQEVLGDECVTFHSKMKAKERKAALKTFDDGRTKKRIISSVKALNAGFNVPECSLGICCAGSSKGLDNVQRTGRTLRLMEGKVAIYVNLYVKGSQELKWVRKRTKKDYQTQWIDNVEQIKP
jgi:superfamily II DNA or RNA helicase